MRQSLAAVAVVMVALRASEALACGGPILPTPGFSGTAVAEGDSQISVFVASESGYAWDRLQGPNWTRTHVLDVTGLLTGNIETDPRVETAISVQNGNEVEIASSGVTPISTSTDAATTVFGAALDPQQHWQVLTYNSSGQTLALFSETAPGTFQEASTLHASCGDPSMLDAVVEPDGTFVGLCSGQAVLLADGKLELTKLHLDAMGLGRAFDGTALFYGQAVNGTDLVRMSRSGSSWVESSTLPNANCGAQWLMPVDENNVVVNTTTGFVAYALNQGTWQASPALTGTVISALGSPAKLLSGQYELTLFTQSNGNWTPTDLGAMGVPPTPGRDPGVGVGCESTNGSLIGSLLMLALFGRRRMQCR